MIALLQQLILWIICYIFFLDILQVQVTSQTEQIPFGVGVASDPMSLRRGGKKLPMEDVSYYQWPLLGIDKVW